MRSGLVPGFRPIGGGTSLPTSNTPSTVVTGLKRPSTMEVWRNSGDKVSNKKSVQSKFGVNFHSAGTLMSIGEQLGKDTPLQKDFQKTPIIPQATPTPSSSRMLVKYTTAKWDKEGDFEKRAKQAKEKEHASRLEKAPPPLKSRQRELIMEGYLGSSDEEEELTVKKKIVKKPTKFKFSFGK